MPRILGDNLHTYVTDNALLIGSLNLSKQSAFLFINYGILSLP